MVTNVVTKSAYKTHRLKIFFHTCKIRTAASLHKCV